LSAAALKAAASQTQAQTASKPALNAFTTALGIVRTEGITGLYRGLSASYLGVTEGVIQWVLYEVSFYVPLAQYTVLLELAEHLLLHFILPQPIRTDRF
jgi:hypothetical protein